MKFRQRIKYFFIRKTTKLLIHLIVFTCRVKISGEEFVTDLRQKKIPVIYIYWHRHIFFTIYRFRNSGARPLISLSPDGEIVAQIAREFGLNPVRGSSSKGGARAFLKLLNTLKDTVSPGREKVYFFKHLFRKKNTGERRNEILITADGPKGPLKEIKDGTILLAQKTGSVIVPFSWYSSRVKILEKTWDRFIIPLPFGTITFIYGSPVFVSPDKKRGDFADLKKELKESLDNLEKKAELPL
jgi:lysophospholipid acyltransferase (LPLAT)-like uncharacterized protein